MKRMRVKRELWRTTMAPTRSVTRLAASARSAREKNEDAERKEQTQMGEKREREFEWIYERESLSE